MLTRKGPAQWLESGRGCWPCPRLSHRSGGMCACFSFTLCTSPSDAARCSKAPACIGGLQLPQSSAVGRHQPARSQHNQHSLPAAQHVPSLSPAPGKRCQWGHTALPHCSAASQASQGHSGTPGPSQHQTQSPRRMWRGQRDTCHSLSPGACR